MSVGLTSTITTILAASDQTRAAYSSASKRAQGYKRSVGGIARGAVAATAAVYALSRAWQAFDQQIIQVLARYEQINKTLRFAAGGVEAGAKEFQFAAHTADRYALSLEGISGSYGRLLAASRGAGLNLKETRVLFEGVSAASAALNLSAEDTNLVIVALSQIASKGVVSMEELRRQMGERIPGVFKIAADAMGLGIDELIKLVSEGKVASDFFLKRFGPAMKEVFGQTAQENINTITGSINRLATAWDRLKVSVSEDLPIAEATNYFTKLLNQTRKFFFESRTEQVERLSAFGVPELKEYRRTIQKEIDAILADRQRLEEAGRGFQFDPGHYAEMSLRIHELRSEFDALNVALEMNTKLEKERTRDRAIAMNYESPGQAPAEGILRFASTGEKRTREQLVSLLKLASTTDDQRLVIAERITMMVEKEAELRRAVLKEQEKQLKAEMDNEAAARRSFADLNDIFVFGRVDRMTAERAAADREDAQSRYDFTKAQADREVEALFGPGNKWEMAGENFGERVRDGISQALLSGNFEDIGAAFQQAISAALIDAIFQGIGLEGAFKTLFGAIGGLFGGIGRSARGGPIAGGSPTWVGEEGPELFIPRLAGNILDHNKSMAAAGGGDFHNNIYISGTGLSAQEVEVRVAAGVERGMAQRDWRVRAGRISG